MLGKRNMRESIGYVTLGLFSHALLDELLEAKSNLSIAPKRKEMIELARDSLLAVDSPEKIPDRSRFADLVFQNYQEITTLRSVLNPRGIFKDSAQVEESLNIILRDKTDRGKRGRHIEKAIGFFRELAKNAIINAETPEERIPPGVRQVASSPSFTQLYSGS